jgi:hypothetical protein
MWTKFWDMRSGGCTKEPWTMIYIEAPVVAAVAIFCRRFGHHPRRVTCPCCRADYRITAHATLREATAAHRGCRFQEDGHTGHTFGPGGGHYVEEPQSTSGLCPYQTLTAYIARKDVLIIRASALIPHTYQVSRLRPWVRMG